MTIANTFLAICAVLALSVLVCRPVRAEDDDPAKNVELRLEGACDANNSKLWLINNHATRAIIAQVRWSLANSKRVINDRFQVVPSAKLEIGCAARADIVSVQYAP